MCALSYLLTEQVNRAVVPNRWVATQRGSRMSGCGVTNSRPNSLLKSRNFRTAHFNILCYISKTETRMDFFEDHFIYVINPI